MEEAKSEKQDFQRVRLWLNQITPDNFEKKSGELRELLIGNAKIMGEPGFNAEEAKKMKSLFKEDYETWPQLEQRR